MIISNIVSVKYLAVRIIFVVIFFGLFSEQVLIVCRF
jgi:hypothetical protein